MKKLLNPMTVAAALIFLLGGCISAQQHASDVQEGLQGDRLTVGTVQREIRQGMSGAEVAEVLGSPNIVSTDEKGREVWIYDKIATDTVYSNSEGGIMSLILGGGPVGSGGLGGGLGGGSNYSTGAASKSQRTLTVIIKFGEDRLVRDFAYHSSRF
jgi:outer membrane protein assembly factor BamE (lipoprotein component of BamABCDE complex)